MAAGRKARARPSAGPGGAAAGHDSGQRLDHESLQCPDGVGDRLVYAERVTAPSEPKTTALGVGHFVTTHTDYRRDDGTLVATNENVLFR